MCISQDYAKMFYAAKAAENMTEILKRTISVGETELACANCSEVVWQPPDHKTCPRCKTQFAYAAYHGDPSGRPSADQAYVNRRAPGLVYIGFITSPRRRPVIVTHLAEGVR